MDDLEEGEIDDNEPLQVPGKWPSQDEAKFERAENCIPRDFWQDNPTASQYYHSFDKERKVLNQNEQYGSTTSFTERPRMGYRRESRARPVGRQRNYSDYMTDDDRYKRGHDYSVNRRFKSIPHEDQSKIFSDTEFRESRCPEVMRNERPSLANLDHFNRYRDEIRNYKNNQLEAELPLSMRQRFSDIRPHKATGYIPSSNYNLHNSDNRFLNDFRGRRHFSDVRRRPVKDAHNSLPPSFYEKPKSQASRSMKEDANQLDEYDLDDFELLLERHRLIQQQLSAIARQEQDLKNKMSRNTFFDEIDDFKVIPNPNSIEDVRQALPSDKQIIKHEIGAEELEPNMSSVLDLKDKKTEDYRHMLQHSHPSETFTEQDVCLEFPDMAIDSSIAVELKSVDTEIPVKNFDERIIIKNDNVDRPIEGQRKVRRRVHRKKLKTKSSNILEVAKGQTGFELRANYARLRNVEKVVSTGRKLSDPDTKDNYQAIPMDLEDESENVGRLLGNDYYMKLNQIAQQPETLELPWSSDESALSLQKSNTEPELISAIGDMEIAGPDLASNDDNEDDLLLREQLLQSLASKRAEKAKAMLAEQQKVSSAISLPKKKAICCAGNVSTAVTTVTTTATSITEEKSNHATKVGASTLTKVKSESEILKKPKYPINESSFPSKHEKVIIQIGNDTDSEEEKTENQTEAASSFLSGAINDLLKEARHGSKTAEAKSTPETSTVQTVNSRDDTRISENTALLKSLQKCILDAHVKLDEQRAEAKKDESTRAMLMKRISIRKTKIEQHDNKIKRLSQLLATIEKAKMTLNSQCKNFEEQISSLNRRIAQRTDRTKSLEEELLRARSILSTVRKRENLMSDQHSIGSTSNNDVSENSSETEAGGLVNERIKRSIETTKMALTSKISEAVKVSMRQHSGHKRKVRLVSVGPVKKQKQDKTGSASSLPQSASPRRMQLQDTKRQLEALEGKLRDKLEQMRAIASMSSKKERLLGAERDQSLLKRQSDLYSRKTSLNIQKSRNTIDLSRNTASSQFPAMKHDAMNIIGNTHLSTVTGEQMRAGGDSQRNSPNKTFQKRNIKVLRSSEKVEASKNETDGEMIKEKVKIIGTHSKEDCTQSMKDKDDRTTLLGDLTRVNKTNDLQHQKGYMKHCKSKCPSAENFDLVQRIRVELEKEIGSNQSLMCEQTLGIEDSTREVMPVVAYELYRSSLLLYRSYRLCPYFRTREKKSISSNTFSNKVNALQMICQYDLNGKCLDEKCGLQHASDVFKLSEDELLQDIILYEPSIAGIMNSDANDAIKNKINDYIIKLRQQYNSTMSTDQLALLLINNIKEIRRARNVKSNPPYYNNVVFDQKPKLSRERDRMTMKATIENNHNLLNFGKSFTMKSLSKQKEESQEIRYFEEKFDILKLLQATVDENPSDVKSWMLLAEKIMTSAQDNDSEATIDANLNLALNILSRALEANPSSENLWMTYLELYSKKAETVELRELYAQAIEYCCSYKIWWKCLELEEHFEEKAEICLDMIEFLVGNTENTPKDVQSHRILETLLYLVQLEILRGKSNSAKDILQMALSTSKKDDSSCSYILDVSHELLVMDLTVLWLCYLSVSACNELPSSLFDPSYSGPSKITSKSIDVFSWDGAEDLPVAKLRETIKHALKALHAHPNYRNCDITNILPLYETNIDYEIRYGNQQAVMDVLTDLRTNFKDCPMVSIMLLRTMVRILPDSEIILHFESKSCQLTWNEELVYEYANWLASKGRKDNALRILREAVQKKFKVRTPSKDQSQEIQTQRDVREFDCVTLFKRVLRISTEVTIGMPSISHDLVIDTDDKEYAFLWLNYCLLLELESTLPSCPSNRNSVNEAFEIAVNSFTSKVNRKILWRKYLNFSLKRLCSSNCKLQSLKSYIELTRRCLACISSSTTLPFSTNEYWDDFTFHNEIICECLNLLPMSFHGQFLHESLRFMPNNINLALRTCQFEIGNQRLEEARNIYGYILKIFSHALPMWKMAISVELKSDGIREARWLYEEATKKLPSCASLWKERILFEMAHGSNSSKTEEKIKEIAERGMKFGIDTMDLIQSFKR